MATIPEVKGENYLNQQIFHIREEVEISIIRMK